MKWSRWQSVPAVAAGVLERLTAIGLHAYALRRRLRRSDPAARAEAHEHLDAIEAHADQAADLVQTLVAPGDR